MAVLQALDPVAPVRWRNGPMFLSVCVSVLALAALNGANDLPKTFATLLRSDVARERSVRRWALGWLCVGGCAAIVVVEPMYETFAATVSAEQAAQVLAGASCWLLLATWAGWPVSTTHALAGATVAELWLFSQGAGLPPGSALWRSVLLPLTISPPLAFSAVVTLRWLGAKTPARFSPPVARCTTATQADVWLAASPNSGEESLRAHQRRHWWAVGAVSFARALQDAAKVSALGILAFGADPRVAHVLVLAVVAVMAAGGWVISGPVERRLVCRVGTSPGAAVSASYVTALLVICGTLLGLPLSTTHVSVAAIAGSSVERHVWKWGTQVFVAWVLTPLGAAAFVALLALSEHATPQ